MKTKVLEIHKNKLLFFGLAGLCVLSAILYVYGINRTVHNVAERQTIEQELSTRVVRVSDLEFEYMDLKNSVTLDRAIELGFRQTDKVTFVSRKNSVAFLPGTNTSR